MGKAPATPPPDGEHNRCANEANSRRQRARLTQPGPLAAAYSAALRNTRAQRPGSWSLGRLGTRQSRIELCTEKSLINLDSRIV